MNFATIGGITLHYLLEGVAQRPPLVFLNSLGTDLRAWDGVIPYVADRFTILRYDKRGHGLSDCPPGPYTLEDHADDLLGLLDQLALPPAILIGVSVGGMIALQVALQQPARVRALVLCDTGAKIGTADFWTERINAVRTKGLEAMAPAILSRWFSSSFAQQQPAAYCGYGNLLKRTPVEGYVATCAALRDADLREAVKTLQTPALVLCGDEDLATPPALGRELAATLPQARFALVPQAGHIPAIEQPATLVAQITQFLAEVIHE